MSGLVAVQNQSLEDTGYILPQTVGYMLCGQVVLVEFVRDQLL
jgi:hypothetical protein